CARSRDYDWYFDVW
nr:immunoglobulin heavy chain junction region [Mus musculus]